MPNVTFKFVITETPLPADQDGRQQIIASISDDNAKRITDLTGLAGEVEALKAHCHRMLNLARNRFLGHPPHPSNEPDDANKPLMPDCYGNFHAGKTKTRECGLCTEVDACRRLSEQPCTHDFGGECPVCKPAVSEKRCKHGVILPHECRECEAEIPEVRAFAARMEREAEERTGQPAVAEAPSIIGGSDAQTSDRLKREPPTKDKPAGEWVPFFGYLPAEGQPAGDDAAKSNWRTADSFMIRKHQDGECIRTVLKITPQGDVEVVDLRAKLAEAESDAEGRKRFEQWYKETMEERDQYQEDALRHYQDAKAMREERDHLAARVAELERTLDPGERAPLHAPVSAGDDAFATKTMDDVRSVLTITRQGAVKVTGDASGAEYAQALAKAGHVIADLRAKVAELERCDELSQSVLASMDVQRLQAQEGRDKALARVAELERTPLDHIAADGLKIHAGELADLRTENGQIRAERDKEVTRVAELERRVADYTNIILDVRVALGEPRGPGSPITQLAETVRSARDRALAELAAEREEYNRALAELEKRDLAAMTERADRNQSACEASAAKVMQLTAELAESKSALSGAQDNAAQWKERAEKAEALLAGAIFSGRLDDLRAGDLHAFASNARAEADALKQQLQAVAVARREDQERMVKLVDERDALKARKVKLPRFIHPLESYTPNEVWRSWKAAVIAAGVEVEPA